MTKYIDHTEGFLIKTTALRDRLPGLMAAKIESTIKTSGEVPLLQKSTHNAQRGALRSSIRSQRLSEGKWSVTAGKGSPASAYAAAQEAGTTRGHTIKNYSTPGTGPHFFQHGIDKVTGEMTSYVRQAAKAVGLGIK